MLNLNHALSCKTDEVLAKYRFTAANEALKLTKITIELPAGSADEINSLSLWDGTTKVTGDVTVTNATPAYAEFNSFVPDFVIAKDTTKTLTVKANTNTIGGGADSDGTAIIAVLAENVGETQFEARGVSSNTVLDDGDVTADISARSMYLRNLPTIDLINGTEQVVYSFTVAADANEDAAMKQLVFNVSLTDNAPTDDTLTLGSFKLYRGNTDITGQADIHAKVGTSLEAANLTETGNGTDTAAVIVTFGNETSSNSEEIIAKGTSNTYTLRATSGGFVTGAENDSVSVVLNNDASAQTAGYVYLVDLDTSAAQRTAALGELTNEASANDGTEGVDPTLGANIIWSDNSDVPHDFDLVDSSALATDSTSGDDWINGFLLKNLPFSGRVMFN